VFRPEVTGRDAEWAVPEKGDVEDMAVVKAANPFSGRQSSRWEGVQRRR
jgi:hypothetical protein